MIRIRGNGVIKQSHPHLEPSFGELKQPDYQASGKLMMMYYLSPVLTFSPLLWLRD